MFAFDAVSYFLQAFAGEILLIFPVVYGFTNSAPFNTWNIEFALYFFPFIITGILPTVAALGWQKTPSAKVTCTTIILLSVAAAERRSYLKQRPAGEAYTRKPLLVG